MRDAGDVALTRGDGPQADEDDDQKACQLDHGQDHIGLDALTNTTEINGRDDSHEGECDQRDTDPGFQIELKRPRKVSGECTRCCRCGGDARTHDSEGDDEGDEVDAECLVRIKRCTAAFGYFVTSSR